MNVCLLTRLRPKPRTRPQKSERLRSSLGGSLVLETIDHLPVLRSRIASVPLNKEHLERKDLSASQASIEPFRCSPMFGGGHATQKQAPRDRPMEDPFESLGRFSSSGLGGMNVAQASR